MIATIVNTTVLGKVVVYAALFGVGIATVFGVGVSSVALLLEALRSHRTASSILWGTLATVCVAATVAAMVLGIVVLSTSKS